MTHRPTLNRALIYQRAARLLERRYADYCCNAIYQAAVRRDWVFPAQRDTHPLVASFVTQFKPLRSKQAAWYGSDNERQRNARIVGLCFMAAMVEAGDV